MQLLDKDLPDTLVAARRHQPLAAAAIAVNNRNGAFIVIGAILRTTKEDRMNVSLGERWESFVAGAVRDGRYGSVSEVVREGLRLVEEREAKLQALRETLHASIAEGGELDDADIDAVLAAKSEALAKEGF